MVWEALGEVSGGRLAPRTVGPAACLGQSVGLPAQPLHQLRDPFCQGSYPEDTVLGARCHWTLTPETGLPSLVSRVLTDAARPRDCRRTACPGLAWWRALWAPPGSGLHSPAPSGSLCLHLPSQAWHLVHPARSRKGPWGFSLGWVVSCSSRLAGGGDTGGQCRVCWEAGVCQPQGLERVRSLSSTLIFVDWPYWVRLQMSIIPDLY